MAAQMFPTCHGSHRYVEDSLPLNFVISHISNIHIFIVSCFSYLILLRRVALKHKLVLKGPPTKTSIAIDSKNNQLSPVYTD